MHIQRYLNCDLLLDKGGVSLSSSATRRDGIPTGFRYLCRNVIRKRNLLSQLNMISYVNLNGLDPPRHCQLPRIAP